MSWHRRNFGLYDRLKQIGARSANFRQGREVRLYNDLKSEFYELIEELKPGTLDDCEADDYLEWLDGRFAALNLGFNAILEGRRLNIDDQRLDDDFVRVERSLSEGAELLGEKVREEYLRRVERAERIDEAIRARLDDAIRASSEEYDSLDGTL